MDGYVMFYGLLVDFNKLPLAGACRGASGHTMVGSCSRASMFSSPFSHCFLSVFCFVQTVGLLADRMMGATWNRSSSGGGDVRRLRVVSTTQKQRAHRLAPFLDSREELPGALHHSDAGPGRALRCVAELVQFLD